MIERDSTGETAAVAGGTVVVVTVTVLGASATDKTAPILAFVGAILVALIAAYTANRRQARALEAESERQGQALAAEGERLGRQLEHDRELADLDDMRQVFDDAAVALHDASVALAGLERALVTGGATFRSTFPDAVPVAELATETLKSIRGRLGVRLPADHVAITAFAKAHDSQPTSSARRTPRSRRCERRTASSRTRV